MSIRLLIGRSGTGKTTFCLNEIIEKMQHSQEGNHIIYLVPDQMTFLSEYKLIATPNLGGMIRTQVFSFSRLAWRVLQETGGISRYHLNSVGINMLIRKIMEDKKEQLKLFQRASDKNGFVGQMEVLLTEFKRYLIAPEELAEKQFALEGSQNVLLQDKLHDIEILYRAFEDALLNKYIDSEDYLNLLGEKTRHSRYLQNAIIYVDGFQSFTPQEYNVLAQLMKVSENMTIALTLDQPFVSESPDDFHLFRMTGETCQTLIEMAKVEGKGIEILPFENQHRLTEPSLQHLERYFDTRPAIPYDSIPGISIAQSSNRRAEVEGVMRKIRLLVRKEGYRYRDIAILMRNTQEYGDLIENISNDYDVPVFVDQKRNMLNHPLIEFVRSSIEVIYGYWRYEPVFRAVKTELLFPLNSQTAKMRTKMDVLENYILQHGIQGDKWTKKETWKYSRFKGLEFEGVVQTSKELEIEHELNELRRLISEPILRLARKVKKANIVKEYCSALYEFLEELDIPAKLEKWELAEEEEGNLVEAKEHDQAWNSLMDLLDQFVEILGDEEMNLKKFATILDAGLESMRFTLVPPAIDQVLIADLEKSRFSDIKICFVIGLNDGVLPAKFPEDGLLADEDRMQLVQMGMQVAPSRQKKLLDEEFLAYHAFTVGSDHLYLSYPMANDEGKALLPSPYIQRMMELFPKITVEQYVHEVSELSREEQLNYIAHQRTALAHLTAQLSLRKRNYPIYDIWWDVYNYYMVHPYLVQPAKKVLSSLYYRNETKALSDETTKELYTDLIQGSVSRMELFSSCPFSHFAKHGLKLQERQIYRLDAPDIGELFHGALKYIVETVMVSERSWDNLTRAEIEALAKESVELLAPKLQHEILLSSNRHHYIKRKLEHIISRASFVLQEHAKASGFAPLGLELGFGPKQKLPPMEFSLQNGTKMELVGRIDRVDMAQDAEGVYLRVLDYKSSAKELNINEVYYGLALQMLTYLDIILTHSTILVGKEAQPAGVLYFHVHNPMINTTNRLDVDELEQELFKKFKMNGLLLGEENIVRLMDNTLDTGESQIISAGIKKDGMLSKRSKVATRSQFEHLRRHVREQYIEKGNAIMDGDVRISPYKMKERTPCTFCSYKEICQFDESMESNEYRRLVTHSKEDIMELIRKEDDVDDSTKA